MKRELLFDGVHTTPKKAKAPSPPLQKIKNETGCPTAAKSGPPSVDTHVPSAEPKHVVPTPVPTFRAKPRPTTKVETVPKPVATPARAAEPAKGKVEMKEAAASLRRMTPLPSASPTTSEDSGRLTPEEMAEQRLRNKQHAVTNEELELFQLENAIMESLVEKTDDEIHSMMEEIQQHPMFPKFAQVQIEETGFEDWSFHDSSQIPIWEIWLQQFMTMGGSPESTSKASVPTPVRKAGALRISPPPKAAVAKPAAAPPVTPKSAMHLPPPPPKQVAVPPTGSPASSVVPKTSPVVPKTVQAAAPKNNAVATKTAPVPPKAVPKTTPVVPKTNPVVPKTSSGGDGSMSAFAIEIRPGSEVA